MARAPAEDVIKLYEQAKNLRQPHEPDWRKAAAYCLPAQYATWFSDGPLPQNGDMSKARRVAFDTTGGRSVLKYAAILSRLATPEGQRWHTLTPSLPSLRGKPRVRAYFDDLTGLMFKYRYNPRARFRVSTSEMYMSLGVYGNAPLYIGERKPSPTDRSYGIKYVSCPMKDVFVLTDDDGEVVIVFRRFWLNVRQFKKRFPDEAMPVIMQSEANKPSPAEDKFFEFVHVCMPRDDYDETALDPRRHPILSSYICVPGKAYVGSESGYRSMPYKIPRTMTISGDGYGFSPAVVALAALGGASAIKKTVLKQGNKAVDPPLLAYDDNAMNGQVDQRPAAINYGGVSRDGKPLIMPLKGGDFRVSEILLQDERRDIEDSFFVTLFQILTETPEMTATEVMERVAEKAALLAPTMGALQSEFLGPLIEREIDILAELGVLPEMPPELKEAQGEYEVVYTSPLAKSIYAEEVSGFMRAVEMSLNVAQATQDMALLDHYNFDAAIPEIADYMAVPARWMNDKKAVDAKGAARQQQMQQEQMMQNAPALASAAKTAAEMGKQ